MKLFQHGQLLQQQLNTSVECSDAAALVLAQAMAPVATDNCGSVTYEKTSGDFVAGACGATGTYTNTWIAKDECNNPSTMFTQVITITDETVPAWTTLAAALNTSVECSDAAALVLAQAMEPVATDNCGSVTYEKTSGDFVAGACGATGTYTNTWIAKDECNNPSTMFTQVITITDETVPAWTTLAAALNTSVECSDAAALVLAQAMAPVATDNCGSVTYEKTSGDFVPGACGATGTYTNTWIATDECNNPSTMFTQVITITDETVPAWTTLAAELNTSVECSDAAALVLAQAMEPVATDNCGSVTYEKTSGDFVAGACGATGTYTNTWIAKDECNNPSTMFTQVITITDETVPAWTTLAAALNTSVECSDAAALVLAQAMTPVATDNCGSVTYEKTSGDFVAGACGATGTYTNTWIAKDECNNPSTMFTQVITITDETVPAWTTLAAELNTSVECSDAAALVLAQAMAPVATDNCGLVTYEKTSGDFVAGACGATGTYTNTWIAKDECNNPSTMFTQVITITDETVPAWTTLAAELNTSVECSDAAALVLAQAMEPVATDNCGSVTYEKTSGDFVAGACGATGTYTNTWIAKDECNNPSTMFTQVITITDETVPAWTTLAAALNTSVECSDAAALVLAQAMAPVATDNCGSVTYAKTSGDFVPGACGATGTYTNTWIATDECNNPSTMFTQVITITDETVPAWTTLAAELNTSVECSDAAALVLAQAMEPVATDNCGSVTYEKTSGDFVAGACGATGTYTNTWIAKDECNNPSTMFTQVITITDETVPAWTTLAAALNTSVECSDAAALVLAQAMAPVATDNCGSVTYEKTSGDFVAGACGATGTYTNTWIAKDECNNPSAMFTQVITITDETAPLLSDTPANTTASSESVPEIPVITATDACSGLVNVDFEQSSTQGDNPYECSYYSYQLTRTWTTEDFCGNPASHTQIITVIDDTEPLLIAGVLTSCYKTVGDALDAAETATTYSDNIAQNDALTVNTLRQAGPYCNSTITVTVSDPCGNSETVTYNNVIIDGIAPIIIGGPSEDIVSCNPVVNWITPTATDNCGAAPELTSNIESGATFEVGTTTVIYTAMDCAGNTATYSFNVTVYPTPTATISGNLESCETTTLTAETDAVNAAYVWYKDDVAIEGETDVTLDVSVSGDYKVKITNENGCFLTSDPVAVVINPLPVVDAGTYGPVCIDTDDITLVGTPEGGVWSGTGVNGNVFDPSVGTQELTYTYTDGETCVNSDIVTISVNPLPLVEAGIFAPVCADADDIILAGDPIGGEWSGTGVTGDQTNGFVFDPSFGTQTITYTVTNDNNCVNSDVATITVNPMPVLSETHVNVRCYEEMNGSIDITVNDGTGSFTYEWSNGETTEDISGLSAGQYTVTVTDANGCSSELQIEISQPDLFVGTATVIDNILCYGGEANVMIEATGGTEPYAGVGNFNYPAGTINIGITDANGCLTVAYTIITEPDELVATVTGTNVDCNGNSTGTASVSVEGGTSTYSYLWSNAATTASISGLAAGTYSVTVTDANGCSATGSYTVTESDELVATVTGTNVDCNGNSTGTASVSVEGGTSTYSYLWSNAATTASVSGLAAGTYSVTVTDANGCSATGSYTVTESDELVATVTGTNVDCNGNSTGTASVSVEGGTSTYSYLWSNAATTASVSGLAAGTYSVTVTDANGCSATGSYTVTESDELVATVTGTNVDCNGNSTGTASVSVEGGTSTYSYLWSNAATTASISGLAAGTYSVTVTDANGCSATGSYTVTESDELVATVTGTNVDCNGNSTGTASVSVEGGTSTYSYLWSNAATTASVSGLAAGTYSVTVTDANGCSATGSYTVTESDELVATVTGTNVDCNGNSTGTASVSVEGGTSTYSYLWSNAATTASVSGLAAGTYSVTVTDANGCSATGSYTVTESDELVATVTGTNVDCNGNSTGTASVSVEGGTSTYSYLWSNAATTASISGLAAGTYSVTVTDANGCSATGSYTVTESDELVATVTGTNVDCNGNSTGTASVSVEGGTSTYSYLWSNAATTASVSGLAAGTYSVTVTDANGCSATGSYTVTESDELVATVTGTNVDCNGNSTGTASVSVEGGTSTYSYLWSNAATTASVSGLAAGTYSVTVTDANGCSATGSYTVTESDELVATVTGTNVDCNGNSTGTASVSVEGGTSTYSYLWSNAATTASVSGLAAGTYSVTVTDANGCSATGSYTVTESDELVATVTGTNVDCNGNSTGTASVSVEGGTSTYSYLWSNAATTASVSGLAAGTYSVTVTDANGCSATGSYTVTESDELVATVTGTNVDCNGNSTGTASVSVEGGTSTYSYLWSNAATTASVSGLAAGTYSVTVTDANGCSATGSYTVTESDELVATVTGTNVDCNGNSTGTASVSVEGGTSTYSYLWSNAATTASVSGLAAGTYSVTVTDANGCSATGSYTVTESDELVATVTGTNVDCNGNSTGTASVSVEGGTSTYSYLWSNAATTASVSGLAAGTYSVTVTDANGCSATGSYTVTESDELVATVTGTNVDCNGNSTGTASVSVEGGTSTYSYLWSNAATTASVSGLAAGTYSVTVTDANGCSATGSYTVTESDELVATVTGTNVDCNGNSTGTASVSVEGGTSTYSYLWSNAATTASISGLAAGTYSVTVTDANGCSATGSYTVTESDELVATVTGTNVDCNGNSTGTASVSVEGGTSTYSYLWSNAATTASVSGLAAGTYSVTVTDANGCSATGSYTVTESDELVATVTGTNVDCNGNSTGTASVSVEGGTSTYSYLWSNAATTASVSGLAAGTYSVTVTDANGCSATGSYTVTESDELVATVTGTNVDCNGNSTGTASVSVEGGTSTYSYLWSNAATTASVSGLAAGTYSVTVTDANGCSATGSYTVTESDELVATVTGTNVDCNGNSTGTASVSVEGGTSTYSYLWSNAATTASVSGLAAGTYSVTVTDANGCSATGSYTVTESDELVATVTGTNVDCNGNSTGTASVSVEGGTSTYSYLWSNAATTASISGLAAGTYSVTVTDANGCSATGSYTVTEPDELVATVTAGTISCNGGTTTVTVTATGGTAPYSGTGSHTVGAGIHIYTVTDANGCSSTTSVTITQPDLLVVTATEGTIACNSGTTTVTVTATGGTGTYTGTGVFTVPAGAYTYTVSDVNGCQKTVSGLISQPLAITATISAGTIAVFGGTTTLTTTASGGTTPYQYSLNGADYQSANTFTIPAGTYTVTVKDANGCIMNSNTITVNEVNPPSTTAGNTVVYGSTSILNNRRAIPVTMTESGTITSISIYHNAGSGNVILGVYSTQSGRPSAKLGVTASTPVSNVTGWQTITLDNPVFVNSGQTIWLAWVFQNNPGIRYTIGTPARAESSQTWLGGMPSSFGSSSFGLYRYSIYCNYTPVAPTPVLTVSPTTVSLGYGSGTNGTFNINSNISWNVSDDAGWLNLSSASGSNNGTVTVTANSANTGTAPRSATVTISGNGVINSIVTVTQDYQPSTAGITEVFGSTSIMSNRRAVPVTFTESGTITSISIYHNGGTGNVYLGVYSTQSGGPSQRLGVTALTPVNAGSGWQTVTLTNPVSVTTGQTIWLAWVFQNNPGIRFTVGSPARAQSPQSWTGSGSMPVTFGSVSYSNYRYSIYCNYIPNAPLVALEAPKSAEVITTDIISSQLPIADLKVYPNPFSEKLRFEFVSPESVNARIDLYDMTGRMVKTIFEAPVEGGISYEAEFRPETIISGMYVYRVTLGEAIYNGKVVFKKY